MIKVFSFGGGVQSTACLVLAAQGKINYPTFLFCNVGEDSENPETLAYVKDVAIPYAKANGVELIELRKTLRTGETDTIYQRLTRPGSKSIGIPVRMGNNGSPVSRTCTVDFKVNVCDKWLREHGAKEHGSVVGLGISFDERLRVRYPLIDSETPWKQRDYPLVDNRIDRVQCMTIIRSAGLPVPPKSSCYFCPFHRLSVWQEMRQSHPDLFQKACELETFLNQRRAELGRDQVWFSRKLKPLAQVTTELHQRSLFDEEDDVCESGYCMV